MESTDRPEKPATPERDLLRALLDGPSLGRMRLPPALEAAYDAYHRDVTMAHLRAYWPIVVVTIGAIVASLFLFDLVAPELRPLVLVGLAAFYVLIAVVVVGIRFAAVQERLPVLLGSAGGAGLFGMHVGTLLVMPGDPLYTIPQFGVVMVTVAVFGIANLLLRPALVAVGSATLAFAVLANMLPVLVDWPLVVTYSLGATLIGAIIGFAQEMRERTVFLQGRLLLLEKREIDHLARRLDALSRTDALTGLMNRRSFDEALVREWSACARESAPVGLLFIDVDHFKAFNDHYGHQAGDDCLARVGAALAQHAVRPSDLMARYGGEEFVALLPRTGPEGVAVIAARVLAAVDALGIPHAVSPTAPHVTLSIGGASFVPSAGDAPSALVEAADAALYRAKHAGRHRVEAASLPS